MQNKKYIIFDMDGTLIDSSTILTEAINYVRERLSLPPLPNSQILAVINNPKIHAPTFFYNTQEFTKEQIAWFQEYYDNHHQRGSSLYRGVDNLLQNSSQRFNLSIATNAYRDSAIKMLKSNNIIDYFDLVLCADMVKNPKPDREMIDTIVTHYSDDREKFLLIGDSKGDIMAAKNADIDYILVNWGFSTHDEGIKSVDELERVLGIS